MITTSIKNLKPILITYFLFPNPLGALYVSIRREEQRRKLPSETIGQMVLKKQVAVNPHIAAKWWVISGISDMQAHTHTQISIFPLIVTF